MGKTLLFSNVIAIILSLGLMWGCQSTAVGPNAAAQNENLLVRSGFKAKTVTTPKQQQRVSALPVAEVSTVSMEENCITSIRLRPRTGFWSATKPSTMPTNRQ